MLNWPNCPTVGTRSGTQWKREGPDVVCDMCMAMTVPKVEGQPTECRKKEDNERTYITIA